MKGATITRWVACTASAALLAACGGEAPAPSGRSLSAPVTAAAATDNRAPRIARVTLDPAAPHAGDDVVAHVEALDPDGDAVELQFAWTVGGRRVTGRGASLQVPAQAGKGVAIEVEVTAHDGRTGSEPMSAFARVGNRPPELLGAHIEPVEKVKIGTELVAVADARDGDGDAVDFRYRWRVNGSPVEGAEGERFATTGLERGDQVQVRTTASDGEAETAPLDSAPVVLGNSAPSITSTPGGVSADGSFQYALQASDPDGDRNLRYELAQGPEGASVDPLLGEVRWSATRDDAGTHVFEVVVKDGHGGEARQRFEVVVREVPKAEPAATGGEAEEPVASIE